MADETSANVPADRSNVPRKPPSILQSSAPDSTPSTGRGQAGSPQAEPEAHIIEETVIKPAAPPKQPAAAPAPTPVSVSSPTTPVTLPAPASATDIAFVVPEKPVPPPSQPVSSQPPPPPLPPPPSPASPPAIPPATRTPAEFAKEQEVIANILKEIKLPERRMPETPAKESKVFDTTLGAAPPQTSAEPLVGAPDPVPSAGSAPAAESAKQSEGFAASIVSPLRTLKNDLQKIVRLKKMSLVRAVALEEQKRRHPSGEELMREETSVRRSSRTFGILFSATLLATLGAAAFFGVFIVMGQRSGIPAESPQSSILFAESGVPFPLDGNALELKRLLSNARLGGGGTLGSITRIIPTIPQTTPEGVITERPATLEEFLRALGTRVPEELLRALSEDFFFGIHTVDENAPLFVIPVLSYERAFAGMLRWEDTLNADLSPAFTPLPDQTIGSGGLPEKRRFEDVVMRNYDVRVLKDNAGMIELYYSFPTRELLIIAESPYSFTEVLSRLRAERKL